MYQAVDIKHIEIIKEAIPLLLNDDLLFQSQNDDDATIWSGRSPEDGEIDLQGSVHEAERLIRAVTRPYPGAFYFNQSGGKEIIWSAFVSDTLSNHESKHIKFNDGFLILNEVEAC